MDDEDDNPNFTVVKSTLNRFCNNHFIKSTLQDYCFQTNILLNESYLFVNLHINSMLEHNLTSNYNKLDETFFNNVFMGLKSSVRDESKRFKHAELNHTYNLYKELLPTDFQHADTKNKTQLLTEMALQLSTITENHLKLNFYKRFYNYLKLQHPEIDSKTIYNIVNHILMNKTKYDDSNDSEIKQHPLVIQYRTRFLNKTIDELLKYDVWIVLKQLREILIFNETTLLKEQEMKLEYKLRTRNARLFSMLPIKQLSNLSYMIITRQPLYYLLSTSLEEEFKTIQNENGKNLTNVNYFTETTYKQVCNEFFNIKYYETTKKEFHYFTTDGKTVSIVLKRRDYTPPRRKTKQEIEESKNKPKEKKKPIKKEKKKKPVKKETKLDKKNLELIGIDPGLRMVFVGCKNTIDTTTNMNHIIKMSSKQYYNDIKSMRMTTKLNKLIERNNLSNLFSSTAPSRRTSRIEQLSLCIRAITEKLHKLIRTLMESKVREWKFDKYRYQQKKIVEICKMLSGKTRPEQERNVIIGWGNWSNPNNSIIRGHKRGPVKRIVKELKRWCRVETIDEYNTSKKCSKCYNDTGKMKYSSPEGMRTVNDVLRCKNEMCRTYFDRDINGARNMLKKLKIKLGIEDGVGELLKCRGKTL
jgi:hypothetical protein